MTMIDMVLWAVASAVIALPFLAPVPGTRRGAKIARAARAAGRVLRSRLEPLCVVIGAALLVVAAGRVNATLGIAVAGVGLIVIGIDTLIPRRGARP